MSSLAELLRAEGVEEALADRLAAFGELLLAENRTHNLTGAKTEAALVPHIIDSLSLVRYVDDAVVDVGSGGGLPGIPVAIAAGVPVTLIEATVKKARFLLLALDRLGIVGEVIAERAEVAGRAPYLRDHFGFGSIRAVGALTTCAELLTCFLRPGGLGLLQRGQVAEAERRALADAAPMLGGTLEAIVALGNGRNICLVRKAGNTPPRFPRRQGVPSKRPLCMKPPPARDSLGREVSQ